jgi:hypothetical protein
MIRITPVTQDGKALRVNTVDKDFNEVLKLISDDIKISPELKFAIVTKE